MRRFVISFIIVALFFSTTTAAQNSKNAATWYRKAIETYEGLPTDLVESIQNWNWADPNAHVSDEMRLALARIQRILRLAQRGAKQGHSDFDLAYEEGFDLSLPHLRALRGITRLAIADATFRLRDGDSATAAAEIASMYRMSKHLNSDRLLISSRVGNAIFDITDIVAQTGFDDAAFGPSESATMMSALEQFSDSDPFEYVEAMVMEREIMIGWVAEKFSGEGGSMQLTDLRQLATPDDSDQVEHLGAMTEEEFVDSLDQVDQVMNGVIEAFMDPNHEAGRAALKRIGEEIEEGKHGSLAAVLVPAYDNIFDHMHRAEQRLANRKASLALLMTEDLTPEQGANAVTWYLRAIAMLEEIDAEKRTRWATVAVDPDEPIDEEALKTLTEADAIIATMREATQKTRCDFDAIKHSSAKAIPVYLPGFRELANLLIADAVRLFQAGEVDAAVDRLDICLRMSAHLAKDRVITSALVSHHIFDSADAILQRELTQAFLEDAHRVVLDDALKTMSRKDPFGYIAAITVTRKAIQDWFDYKTRGASEKQKSLRDAIRKWGVDQLLAMLVMLRRGGDWELVWPEAETDTLGPLGDALQLEAIRIVVAQGKEMHEAITAGNYSLVTERELPKISPVRERLARARGDLRRCVFAVNQH